MATRLGGALAIVLFVALIAVEVLTPRYLLADAGSAPAYATDLGHTHGAHPGQSDLLCPQLAAAPPDEPQTWRYELTAKQVVWELEPGRGIPLWAWNGSIPGPVICAREGDRVEVTIHNRLPTIVSFHAHGLAFAPDSDGTYHTGSFAMPGGSYTYRYEATHESVGTWAYHDSVAELDEKPFVRDATIPESGEGIERGLYGGIVVYAKNEPPVDHEVLLTMGDVGPEVSRSGTFEVFNGRVAPHTPTIHAAEGERIRFRLINAGPNDPHDFVVTGHVLTNAHTSETIDSDLVRSGQRDSVVLGALTFGDYTLTAGKPGTYHYLCLFGDHASLGMHGAFEVTAT